MSQTIEAQQQLIRKAGPIYLAEQTALNPGLGLILADLSKRFAPKPREVCSMCNDTYECWSWEEQIYVDCPYCGQIKDPLEE